MAAWTFKGESGKSFVDTAVTLESQGVSSATVSFRSLEADILTLEYQVADYAASSTLPELRQTISLYRDSDRFFYGNVIRVSPKVDATSSTVIVEVAGPWWWLDRIPMTSSLKDGEGNSATRPSFIAGTFTGGGDMAININLAIDRAIDLGAPVIKGSISTSFQVPRITLNQSTCGDVISELVRLIPDSMVWFDYDGTGYPTINVSRRADASTPTRTVAVGTDDVTALNIQPLIELEVSEVKVPYVTRATTGETQFVTQDSGSSATGKVEILPVSGPELVDFLPNDQLDTIKIADAYDGDTAGLALAVKKDIYPGWADVVASVAGSEGVNYGLDCTDTFVFGAGGSTITVFRNLSSSAAGGTTEVYPAGTTTLAQTAIPAGKKFVSFENGQQPPQWAIDDYSLTEYFPNVISWFDQNLSGSTYNQARRYAIMDATEWSLAKDSTSNTGIDNTGAGTYMFAIWLPEKSVKLWLCDTAKIPADNTLIRGADFTFAAPPANFAANLLAAQNYIPHEGSIELTSSDTGATRFRGTKVRVTGSLSTMTAMDALVSGETLDIREGSTQVELGQPPRLDFLEFVNRVRRTPQDNTNYTTASTSATLLLDESDVPSPAIAPSTRKLSAAYSGHCMKVRRTSDSAQANVAFDSDGLLSYYSAITVTSGSSTATNLAQFTNGTDAHVVTFYDQSGNGRDFSQATASAQPKIVSNGKLLDMTFERASTTAGDFMTNSYEHSSGATNDPFTYCCVCKSDSTTELMGVMSDITNYNKGVEVLTVSSAWNSQINSIDLVSTFSLDLNENIILTSYTKSSSSALHKLRKNGSEQTRITDQNLTSFNRQAFSIGTRRTTATLQTWEGTIPEVVTFESQLNSTQVAALESNMAAFYGMTLA